MANEEKFLSLYNDLDNALRNRYKNVDRSSSVLVTFINELNRTGSPTYSTFAKKLNMIRVIRNNLIHELDMNRFDLVDITDETIDFLKGIIKLLNNPKRAKDIAKPIAEAFVIKDGKDIKLENVIKEMRLKGFSQVPVLDNNNVLVGVFSPNVVFEYLANCENVCINKLNFGNLHDFIAINKHFSESYLFVRENTEEEEIDNIFSNAMAQNKKPAMIFVTKDGSRFTPVSGIIVLKDLLDSSFNNNFMNK